MTCNVNTSTTRVLNSWQTYKALGGDCGCNNNKNKVIVNDAAKVKQSWQEAQKNKPHGGCGTHPTKPPCPPKPTHPTKPTCPTKPTPPTKPTHKPCGGGKSMFGYGFKKH